VLFLRECFKTVSTYVYSKNALNATKCEECDTRRACLYTNYTVMQFKQLNTGRSLEKSGIQISFNLLCLSQPRTSVGGLLS